MTQKPNIPEPDTIQFLQDSFGPDIAELTLLSGGDWSQAYSFVHQHKKYVLRWCHSSETFEKDAFASRLSSAAMPVPRVVAAGVKFDTHFAITEFAPGKFIDTLNAAELNSMLPALLNLFDALRTADLANTTGYGAWDKDGRGSHQSWQDFLLDVKTKNDDFSFFHDWRAKLAKSPVGAESFDRLYARFETLVDQCPEDRQLIHSDLLHYNLLVADAKISAVIDWQCSIYGDALYDVAWFLFYEPWYPEFIKVNLGQKLMAHFATETANNAHLNARLLCYQLHIALDSIIYNTAKGDWDALQEVVDYAHKVVSRTDA